MSEEEDPQKLKRIAAAEYDYDNDPRWAEYWTNILIPPHMVSRSDVVDHFKRKFYQRHIDPELVVEAMASSNLSQSSRSTTQSSSSSMPQNDAAQTRASGSTASTFGTSATSSPSPTSLCWNRQTIQFSVNAWVFIVAVLAIFPLVPRNLSYRAYRLSFAGFAFSSLYSLYLLYGKPRAWTMLEVQTWFQSVFRTKDFIYFIYSLMFAASHLFLKLALIPILCRAIEHVAKFLRHNFTHSSLYRKYLEEPCVCVESNATTLGILSSHVEIGLGFLQIVSLFSSQRHVVQTFMYLQLLKLMYQAPATAGYHQSVWGKIGRTINPPIFRYAPFLKTPLATVRRWLLR